MIFGGFAFEMAEASLKNILTTRNRRFISLPWIHSIKNSQAWTIERKPTSNESAFPWLRYFKISL